MRAATLALALAVAVTGCTYARLSARGSAVGLLDAAPQGCRNVGFVIGKGGGGMGAWIANETLIAYAIDDARNKAGDLGATHLALGQPQLGAWGGSTTTATVTGYAFQCAPYAPPPQGAQGLAR